MTATTPPSATPWPLQLPVWDLAAFVQDQAAVQAQDQALVQARAQTQAHDGPAAAPVLAAPGPVLLDVREAWERQTARFDLPGARSLHIPMGNLPARLHELDPQQPILVLCHHGVRSQQCVEFLQRQGFEAAYNVAGGIDAWSREVDSAVPRY